MRRVQMTFTIGRHVRVVEISAVTFIIVTSVLWVSLLVAIVMLVSGT